MGTKNLTELREMPAKKLLDAASKQPVVRFSPVVDGQFLIEPIPSTYVGGRQAHVPTIIGWNRDERAGTLSKDMTTEKWKTFAAEHYVKQAEQFLAAFPGNSDDEAARSADAYTTAGFIALGAWRWVEAQAGTGQSPVYRYRFDRPASPSEMHPEGKYAFHSDELEYVFGTLDVRRGAAWRPEDRRLSEQIVNYWANFARTGDPNGEGLPHWPRYDKGRELLHLDDPITVGPDTSRSQFEFLLNEVPRNEKRAYVKQSRAIIPAASAEERGSCCTAQRPIQSVLATCHFFLSFFSFFRASSSIFSNSSSVYCEACFLSSPLDCSAPISRNRG